MRLMEKLRGAEQQSREAARQRFAQARLSLEEAQSRLRRRMRIYPRNANSSRSAAPLSAEQDAILERKPRAIVSINGRDLRAGEEAELVEGKGQAA